MSDDATPAKVRLTDGLGPLPEADGTAEANKERHPEGGYTFDEIPAWSEPLVRSYAAEQVAEERRRWLDTVQHAAIELAELDDETAQVQAAALMRLCGPNVL